MDVKTEKVGRLINNRAQMQEGTGFHGFRACTFIVTVLIAPNLEPIQEASLRSRCGEEGRMTSLEAVSILET